MASVHKDSQGRSPFWMGSYRDEKGKWRLRSTKQRDHAAALAIAERWQRQAESLRSGVKLQNKEAILETFVSATQSAERNEFTEATARKMLDEILVASGQSAMNSATAEDFLNDWLASKALSKAPRTTVRYRQIVREFLSHLGPKAKMSIAAVTSKDILSFRDKQITAGKSAGTANLDLKTLRIPFNVARRQGVVLVNPAEAVDMLSSESSERSVFTPDQLAALVKNADWEWEGMILLGATCGMRIGDAANLTWQNVDLNNRVIRYFPQKTAKTRKRKPLETVILADLEDYLTQWPGQNDKPTAPLFPSLLGKSVSGAHGLSRTFTVLMGKAKIFADLDERELHGKGRRFSNLSFHSLRHTFISTMANSGVPKEIRMKLAGHASNVHERYTHLELETYRSALQQFPRLQPNPKR